MIFNRHNYLSDIIKYWKDEKPSQIGIGLFERHEDFTISKIYGRTDLGLINHTDGKQYVFELDGFHYCNPPKEVRLQFYKEICEEMEQILRSIHFQNWLKRQTIERISYSQLTELLQQGLDSFDYEEAFKMFSDIFSFETQTNK